MYKKRQRVPPFNFLSLKGFRLAEWLKKYLKNSDFGKIPITKVDYGTKCDFLKKFFFLMFR